MAYSNAQVIEKFVLYAIPEVQKEKNIFLDISAKNINGFELSTHKFYGLDKPSKLRHHRLKSMHV